MRPRVSQAIAPIKRLFQKLHGSQPRMPVKTPRTEMVWSIGIYAGDSPYHWVSPESIDNPVLTRDHVTDVPAAFVADPFILRTPSALYMFFEVMNRRTEKGEIAVAVSKDGIRWSYERIVLAEPFHLSYPYVFRWGDDYFMTPESYQANSVRLYKASHFPTRWSFVRDLLTGDDFVDPSVFRFNDRWWLLTDLARPPYYAGILRLFSAENLMGPWVEHPKSPVIDGNPNIARPAGRVVVANDRVIRYAQDCCPVYGSQVRAFEITELTTKSYHEREVYQSPVLTAGGAGWNESGMHHIDPQPLGDGRWLACVDGWCGVEIS